MNLSSREARTRFVQALTATLGTADASGQPHLVPVTYVLTDDDHLYIAIDSKPKRSTDLRRLRNINENGQVSLLIDKYVDDWEQLWWARADGRAVVAEFSELPAGLLEAFQKRYPWYVANVPEGPVIDVTVTRWSGWSFSEI
jgi:PPOX class probable F420-dependent enzyme